MHLQKLDEGGGEHIGKIWKELEDFRKYQDESICNHPIQGTAADGFKSALIDLDRQLIGWEAKIVHILHDEIIVEVREDIAADVAVMVKDCMEQAFAGIIPEVPFVVEPEIRDSRD